MRTKLFWIGCIFTLALLLAGCDGDTLKWQIATVVGPPAEKAVEAGGRAAKTQAAKLLQTAQIKVATESAELKETAKVEAATVAAGVIDTAQAHLVTQSAGQVTALPTEALELRKTGQAIVATEAAQRMPQILTQAASLKETTEARLGTEAAKRFPLTLTQAASFKQTAEAGAAQGTLVPPAAATQAADLLAAARSAAETQAAPFLGTVVPPVLPPSSPAQPGAAIIVYTVQAGETLQDIANLFGVSTEKLFLLNMLRYPWLAGQPQNLLPGMILAVSRVPDLPVPVTPSGQVAWSSTQGCDVAQVDWLAPPILCQPATIDWVNQVEKTAACISLSNPLGYTLHHQVLNGWMFSGVDGMLSYGWYPDREHNTIIVGPALITGSTVYTECNAPGS